MWIQFELALRPAPKKNGRPIFTNKKTGKYFLAENPAYKAFSKAGKKLLKQQMKDRDLTTMTTLLKVRYLFEYERTHHIADICNLQVGLNDLLQDSGVISNDGNIKVVDGARVVQGLRDRCVVWLSPIEQEGVETKGAP